MSTWVTSHSPMYMQPHPQQTFTRWKCDFQGLFVEETQEKKKNKTKQNKAWLYKIDTKFPLTNFLLRMMYYSVMTQANSE